MYKAYKAWQLADTLRERRLRFKRYTFGDQWGDPVVTDSGFTVTEREKQLADGCRPATNNIIRQLVKTVVGCYRSTLDGDNAMVEADARTFEEYLISGCAIQRVALARLPGSEEAVARAEPVSPARFFTGSVSCHDGSDAELLGQLHDLSLQQVILRHSHGDRDRARRLRSLFDNDYMMNQGRFERRLGESGADRIDFYHADAGLCRVIEMWALECVERLRCHDESTGRFFHEPVSEMPRLDKLARRRLRLGEPPLRVKWELIPQWRCRFFAPTGEVIDECVAPFHPYVFKFYPLIDGEIHSFVEDIIEQQRNVNRLLTLNDRLLSTAAKGVLLMPDNQVSRQMPVDELAKNWSTMDGVALYRAVPGLPGPHQVYASPGNLGVGDMVDRQLKLISEVSGVSEAIRGIGSPSARGSATLYDSQHNNSMVALSDIFDSFGAFIAQRDRLLERMAS